ncbi:MAG TPA: glycerate kinase, partial [Paraburkholderia sp.]|nr:glycerate kinase [Paraburkholderia sp.]
MPNHPPTPIVVIAPDSFKGSLGAERVAEAIAAGVRRACPDAVVRICPMADGGEGTLDAMLTRGGERRKLTVRGAAGPVREAIAGITADGSAIVETAEIVGITDPVGMGVPVETRSTRGMGEAIRALLDAG